MKYVKDEIMEFVEDLYGSIWKRTIVDCPSEEVEETI